MIRGTIRFAPAITLLTGLMLMTSACGMFYDNSKRKASPSRTTTAPVAVPVETESSRPFAPVPAPGAEAIAPPASGVHTVVRGNTVYSISRLYGLPVRSIIELNGLSPPYLLKVGDRVSLPQRRGHKVAKGETVYSISRRYGVAMSELTRANGIAEPYTIVVGQDLVIPSAQTADVAAIESPGTSGGTVDVEALPAPSAAATRNPAPAPIASPASVPAPAPVPAPPAVEATPRQIEALPKTPARAGRTFLWPVNGKLISGFGSQQGGRHNDGINIGAKRGTTVVAAENGVVAYAGNELRGFGNLLLIKHADGYMTAYAHNEALLVGRGATVKKGQPIARVGSTGSVGSPQLHFEIRKGRKAVDPKLYLPRQSASN